MHDMYLSCKNDSHQGFPTGVTVPGHGSQITSANCKGMGPVTCVVLVSVASEIYNMMTIGSFISRCEGQILPTKQTEKVTGVLVQPHHSLQRRCDFHLVIASLG